MFDNKMWPLDLRTLNQNIHNNVYFLDRFIITFIFNEYYDKVITLATKQ